MTIRERFEKLIRLPDPHALDNRAHCPPTLTYVPAPGVSAEYLRLDDVLALADELDREEEQRKMDAWGDAFDRDR